jgi:hypothetical protein
LWDFGDEVVLGALSIINSSFSTINDTLSCHKLVTLGTQVFRLHEITIIAGETPAFLLKDQIITAGYSIVDSG